MKKERRHWSADDKIKLLRLHLIEKQAISKICDEASLRIPVQAEHDSVVKANAIPG